MKVIQDVLVVNGKKFNTLEVELPKTTLLLVEGSKGFIMCGALDVDIYDSPKLLPREVICCKAIGVKTMDDLIGGTIYQASNKAIEIGIYQGMKVIDALNFLA